MTRAWPVLLALLGAQIDELGPLPGDFPPANSGQVVDGTLVEADFLHRSGQCRRSSDGLLVDFALPPSGTILYRGAEADLRDVPLGTLLHFRSYPDERGSLSRVATAFDDFTAMSREARTFRIEEIHADQGQLLVTEQGGSRESTRRTWKIDGDTRIWKGRDRVKAADLAVGDEILVNFGGDDRVLEIWADSEARKQATDSQKAAHRDFLRRRGLAARIDRVEGRRLTVTFFGDPESFRDLLKAEGIDPGRWVSEGRIVDTVVANEELRTYNPPVDRKRAQVRSSEALPTGPIGRAGLRWVIEPDILLEGFRKGAIVRIFAHPGWPVEDMPFGECIYSEAPDARPHRIDPNLYPYRVDSGNEHLPWYRPKPGEFPPFQSHHEVVGELIEIGADGRSGRLRPDRSSEILAFKLPPYGTVRSLDAEGDLGDIPIGTRCHVFLHPDESGAFTLASVVLDEFSRLVRERLSYRLDAADLDRRMLLLANQHALVKNDREEFYRPPDFGRGAFAVDERTRVWKDDHPATLRDLVPGDELLLNASGRTDTSPGSAPRSGPAPRRSNPP